MVALDEKNFKIIAAKYYEPDFFSEEDFVSDLSALSKIKKLFSRYKNTGKIKTNLVLNHIILFYNVFVPVKNATILMVYKFREDLSLLKPFLLSLGYWNKEALKELGIDESSIIMDEGIIKSLRKEYNDRKSR
jgi:hypothetical protein